VSQFTIRRALRTDCVTVYNTEGVKNRLCHSLKKESVKDRLCHSLQNGER